MAVIVSFVGKVDFSDLKKAQAEMARMARQADTTANRFSAMGERFKAVGANVTSIGKSMTLGLTLPIVGIGVAATAVAADFETTMKTLQVNAQASGSEMKDLSALAIKMGQDTAYSAGEAATAMLELSKGGLTTAAIKGGALASTMNLAATEGIALGDAATIVVQSMNTFGISADKTASVVDTLAAGAVASTAGVADLAAGMKYVGSTAATMNFPLTDVVTALAAMNNAGLDSTTAGTSLNRMLLGLVPTTDKAQAAMKKYGLSFTDAKGGLLPFDEVVGKLVKTFGNLDQATRTKDLKAIFGVEGMRAANTLINQGVKGYDDLSAAVNKQGIAQDLASARMSGTAGALEQLKGSVETAALAIGQALAPVITKVAGFLKDLADRFSSLPPGAQQLIIIVGVMAAAMGPLLIVVGSLITALGALATAELAVLAPVIAVVAGIALFVGAIVLLWNTSEGFRNAVLTVWNAIRAGIQTVVDMVKAKLDENKEKLDSLKNAFAAVWNFIQQYVFPIIATLVSNYLQGLFTTLGFVIGAVIDAVGALVDFVSWLVKAGKAAWDFASNIGKNLGKAVDFVKDIPGMVLDALKGAGSWLVNVGKDMIQGLLNGAGSLLSKIGEFFLDKLPGWIVGPFKAALGIASPSKVFYGFGQNLIEGLTNALEDGGKELRANMQKKFASWFSDSTTELKKALSQAQQDVTDWAASMSGTLISAFDISGVFKDSVGENGQVVASKWTEGVDKVFKQFEWYTNVLTAIKSSGGNDALMQYLVSQGMEQGGAQGQAMLDNGLIPYFNQKLEAVKVLADTTANAMVPSFLRSGVEQAQAAYEGFKQNFGKGGPARKALMNLMDNLAEAAARDVKINVEVTRNINEVVTRIIQSVSGRVPQGATGGIVTRPTLAIIGEAGPEAVVPLNRTPGSSALADGSAGNTYNITVQAGVGDPRQIGQEVVQYIKRFEQANGPVFASA